MPKATSDLSALEDIALTLKNMLEKHGTDKVGVALQFCVLQMRNMNVAKSVVDKIVADIYPAN